MGKKVKVLGKEHEIVHVKSMYDDYGTNEIFDEWVDSENVERRKRALEFGYGLDKLCDDPDPEIAAKARELYYVDWRSHFLDAGGKLTSAVIFTTENPDDVKLDRRGEVYPRRKLWKFLLANCMAFVPVKACFRKNGGDSYMVFNVGEGSVQRIAGYVAQSSFLYIIPTANGVEAQFWVNQFATLRYHKVGNPYCLMGQVFECAEADDDDQTFARILQNLNVQFDEKLLESVCNAIKVPKSWRNLTDGVGMVGFDERISSNREAIKIVSERLINILSQK